MYEFFVYKTVDVYLFLTLLFPTTYYLRAIFFINNTLVNQVVLIFASCFQYYSYYLIFLAIRPPFGSVYD
jgi:hypothetical protein